jgi:signal transduction histidine kinase
MSELPRESIGTPVTTGTARRRTALGIGPRMLLLVGLGLLAPVALLGWAVTNSLEALTVQVLAERQAVARVLGVQANHAVRDTIEVLASVSGSDGLDLTDADPQPEQEALRRAFVRARVLAGVVLIRPDGSIAAAEPSRFRPADFRLGSLPEIQPVLATGRFVVSSVLRVNGHSYHVFLQPIRDRIGHMAGVIAAVRAADDDGWNAVLRGAPGGARVQLLDQDATIAASNDRTQLGHTAADAQRLRTWLVDRQPVSTDIDSERGGREVIAFAPLTIVPWAIAVRQPDSEVFASVYAMRRRVLVFGPLLVGIGLCFAWGAARSVRMPLATLARAARRIADGDLGRPVPPLPADEIGDLSQSFEAMRVKLADSMDRITRANQELEGRVLERTRELAQAHDELRVRDAVRGQLLRKVISAQEEERKRLARELHDETCQKLAALGIRLDTAATASSVEDIRTGIGDARALATRTLGDIHHVIFDLRPSVLDDLGLLPAIRWYATRQLGAAAVSVRCDFDDLDARLAPEVEISVFRAVQEAINNIARHAHAENALIEISRDSRGLQVEIEDDGEGFDVAQVEQPSESGRGLGLLGLRERIELLGGTVAIDSSPGDGTRVSVRVPTG